MHTNLKRSVVRCACVPIASIAIVALGGSVSARVAAAQAGVASAADAGRVVYAALRALAAPDSTLSRVPVAQRTLVLDVESTLHAFARAGVPVGSLAALELQTPVAAGTRAVLDDCSYATPMPCAGLGWKAYVMVEEVSVTPTEAVVRCGIVWADRGWARFEPGVAPSAAGFLVGFDTTVYFVRAPNSAWRFVRLGTTVVA